MDNTPTDNSGLPPNRHNPFFPSLSRLKRNQLEEIKTMLNNDAKNKINRENVKTNLEISRRNYKVSDIVVYYRDNGVFNNCLTVWLEIKIKNKQNNILEIPGFSYEQLFDFLPSTLKKSEHNTFLFYGTEELLRKSLRLFGYKKVVKKQ